MARHQILVDSDVYYIDTDLEERVKALEAAVLALQEKAGLAASEAIAANLEASQAFAVQLAEGKAQALATEALAAEKAALSAEAPEEVPPEEGA